MRTYRYLVKARVAVVLDTEDNGSARLAVAVCNPADQYSRKTARFILDAMLDQPIETLRALHLRKNVFRLSYEGETPVRDVIKPLMESLDAPLQARIQALAGDAKLAWKGRPDAVVSSVSTFARARRRRERPTSDAAAQPVTA